EAAKLFFWMVRAAAVSATGVGTGGIPQAFEQAENTGMFGANPGRENGIGTGDRKPGKRVGQGHARLGSFNQFRGNEKLGAAPLGEQMAGELKRGLRGGDLAAERLEEQTHAGRGRAARGVRGE